MGSSNAKLQALHQAVKEDNADRVRELLLDEDLDPNARGEEELTALHVAIGHGSLKSVQVMLESDRVDITPLTPARETPLILAITKDHINIVDLLMDRNQDNKLNLEACDSQGYQALHYASLRGHDRLVGLLSEKGVGIDTHGGKLRQTPLMLAAQGGHESLVKAFLESGANPCAVDLAGMTPLHHACMSNAEDCVRLLLASSNDVCVDAKDISGCTPLLYCLNNKNRSMEKMLVSHGANLTEALDAGFSELCYHTCQKS